MKTILAISGSASKGGSNTELLLKIRSVFSEIYSVQVLESLSDLPLFTPQLLKAGIPESVAAFKLKVDDANAIIISTPEYLHNIPAVLKNALEWMTESGELAEKPVLPITFTPAPPRGEYAMKSLLQSLQASKAKVVAELPLFQSELRSESGKIELAEEHVLIIREALKLL